MSSSELMETGPSNLRKPASPTKLPTSPFKKMRAYSDSEDVVEMTVPSSDVDEDEITTNPTRLNPQGALILLLVDVQLLILLHRQ